MSFLETMRLKRELRREQKASLRVERQARRLQAQKLEMDDLNKRRAVAEGKEAIRQSKKELRRLSVKRYTETFGNIKKGVQKIGKHIDQNKRAAGVQPVGRIKPRKIEKNNFNLEESTKKKYDPYEVKKVL